MISIIMPILNSHEVVRRQILHYKNMKLPDDVEIIFVDDGSDPPLISEIVKNLNWASFTPKDSRIKMIETNDFRPWTEHKARNIGAKVARGEYLLMIDVDYVLPREAIEKCLGFVGDRMHFKRYFGYLDEDGKLGCDQKILQDLGLKSRWIRRRWVSGHRSQFLMRADLFWKLGGYNEALEGKWRRTGGAGERFWRLWQRAEERGEMKLSPATPTIYMFPTGKYCEDNYPNLFHSLQGGE